jgi:hypothetical protein
MTFGSLSSASAGAFKVSIFSSPDIVAGSSGEIDVLVENTDVNAGEEEVKLVVDGVERESKTVSVAGEGSKTVSFNWESDNLSFQTHSVRVESNNDEASTSVDIIEKGKLVPNIMSTNSPVTEKEDFVIEGVMYNVGGTKVSDLAEFIAQSKTKDSVSVSVPGEEITDFTLTWKTEVGDKGTYDVELQSDYSSDLVSATVNAIPNITLPDGTTAYAYDGEKYEWNNFNKWAVEVIGDSEIVPSPTYSGNNAVKVSDSSGNESILINNKSWSDAPLEGEIHSRWKSSSSSVDIAAYFRYQDSNNFLVVSYNGGNTIQLNQMYEGSGSTLDSVEVSENSPTSWEMHKIRMWEDGGTLYAEAEDAGLGLLGDTLSTTSHDITSGGGLGIGSSYFKSSRGNNGSLYTDVTTLYYP